MEVTNQAPKVPISDFKRTKIIATIGPATHNYKSILAMMKAGVNGFRLNFSHGVDSERLEQIAWIRQASQEYGKPVAIIQDLHGPKMQVGEFEGIINIRIGQSLTFKYEADYAATGHIPTLYDLTKKVKRGERLWLADGRLQTTITSVANGVVHVRAENDGVLVKKKGINLPDTDFAGDIITAKDKKDLAFGAGQDIDYVAVSFIQQADDIKRFRTILNNLGSHAKIIAKVETKAAAENIEEIVQESDMVMVARGDLAIETQPESVPIIQRKIIGLGLKYAKPTIVATQMLASMTDAPEPTRAEVSDIATAVILGADCVMLSEETAIGKYPIQSIEIMKRVILHVQHNNPLSVTFDDNNNGDSSLQQAISTAVISLATNINATAIVAETLSGDTALQIAAHRPDVPVIAVTSNIVTMQQLAVVYGTKSYNRPVDPLAATKLTDWLRTNKVLKRGDIIVTVSGQHPGVVGTTDTIKVRVLS